MPMIRMTTRSSMRVKPCSSRRRGCTVPSWAVVWSALSVRRRPRSGCSKSRESVGPPNVIGCPARDPEHRTLPVDDGPGPTTTRGGPEGPPREYDVSCAAYQVPPEQPLQVRLTLPVAAVLVMVNVLPDFEV